MADLLSVLKIFAIEGGAQTFDSCSHNQRIIPRQAQPGAQPERLPVKGLRRVNGEERPKYYSQILLSFRGGHGLSKTAESNTKEFLHYLVTDNPFSRGYRLTDKLSRPASLRCGLLIK